MTDYFVLYFSDNSRDCKTSIRNKSSVLLLSKGGESWVTEHFPVHDTQYYYLYHANRAIGAVTEVKEVGFSEILVRICSSYDRRLFERFDQLLPAPPTFQDCSLKQGDAGLPVIEYPGY